MTRVQPLLGSDIDSIQPYGNTLFYTCTLFLAATDVRRRLYLGMLTSLRIGTAAFGYREDFMISRQGKPLETIMDLIKGSGPVENCTCKLRELRNMQDEVKVRV